MQPITAILSPRRWPVTAFTCGFDAPGAKDERAAAEKVARALNLDWRETDFGEADFWRILPQVAWAMDDPTADYAALMEQLFDFDRIAGLLRAPDFRMVFDAMSAITGPYGHAILEDILGFPKGTVMSRLHYARRRVRDTLIANGAVEGRETPKDEDQGDAA